MSTSAPQAISRRPNGVPLGSASQPRETLNKAVKPIAASSHRASVASDKTAPAKAANEVQAQRPTAKNKASVDTAKNAQTPADSAPRRSKNKATSDGAKVVIRRIAPGMTEAECTSILGPDWAVDQGKVDWFSYRPGKVSIDPSKPSRPSRAYLHVVRRDDIIALRDAVRSATWEDARGTFTSPSLIGPPDLEFATYKRIPSIKARSDSRQGTIDQDQEFMDFLEQLANPTPSKASVHSDDVDDLAKEEAKVTTTPLVEYLREKKANKGKEVASSKGAKSSLAKGKGVSREDESSKKRSREGKTDSKTSEPVKILMKKTPSEVAAEAAKNVATHMTSAAASAANSAANSAAPASAASAAPSDAPKSRRAGIAAAARILQRDLGLSPGSAHRRARHDAAKADVDTKTSSSKEPVAKVAEPQPSSSSAAAAASKSPVEPPAASKPQSTGRRGRGGRGAEKGKAVETPAPLVMNPPVILKKKTDGDQEAASSVQQPACSNKMANGTAASGSSADTRSNGGNRAASSAQKRGAAVPAGATRAFVKNVTSSQSMTEAALRQALEAFGGITSIEVDKRRSFAYVDFANHQGFAAAATASPVQVGQYSVQVVERKDKKASGNSTGASSGTSEKAPGRGRRGRGGGGNKANGVANGAAVVPSTTSNGGTG